MTDSLHFHWYLFMIIRMISPIHCGARTKGRAMCLALPVAMIVMDMPTIKVG